MNRYLRSVFSFFWIAMILEGLIAAAPFDFQQTIRPLLSDNCFQCHGPDEKQREADLRLDVQASAHESAIIPGRADESELIARITTNNPDDKMPPPDSGKTLDEADIDALRQWVDNGAVYQGHWSFQTPQRPTPPKVSHYGRVHNPIDSFVLAKLQAEGLKPSEPADKTTLLRRLTLDLTGVPPTIEEVDDFLADRSPNAFETVVDRLLESERYGERMATIWLDAARYADTMGYQADWARTQWRWRTWVIDAYNQNMPFDQFTIEQLAGDLLPNPSVDQRLATGFNRNHRINDEGGIIPEEYLVEYLVDRVETTSGTWLGLTFGCARCHDHKYDPVSQKDFYSFLAFFNGVPEKGKDGRKGYAAPYMRVAIRGKQAEYDRLRQEVDRLSSEYSLSIPSLKEDLENWIQIQKGNLKSGRIQWSLDKPSNIQSGDAIEFKVLDDYSALSTLVGAEVGKPTYRFEIAPRIRTVKALKLEALLHPKLNGGFTLGNGDFVLTDFLVDLIRDGEKKATRLKIEGAKSEHSKTGFPVDNAIDGDPKTGWSIGEVSQKENPAAVFIFKEPIVLNPGDKLKITLAHKSPEGNQAIGRFRLSTTDVDPPQLSSDEGLPAEVLQALKSNALRLNQKQRGILAKHHASIAPELAELREKRETAKNDFERFEDQYTTNVMVMEEMDEPRPTHILERGVYDQPGQLVTAAVPSDLLGPLPQGAPLNRLGLAQWLVSGEHSLTARVVVNRYWAMLFGNGLVETIEDFGLQGAYPSHPKLLDWLATEYPKSGWDTKALLKLIVTSATYQQSSDVIPEMAERDPSNRLLSRMTRFRLPAETIRDQALFTSSLLVEKIGGPSVKPYQPAGLWSDLSFQSKIRTTDYYIQDTGEDLYRRSLYTFWKRTVPPPTMATFDAPSRDMCVLSRQRTNTPLQALALMNDPTFVEAARVLAEKTIKRSANVEEQLIFAFRAILARQPNHFELSTLRGGYQKRLTYFSNEPQQAEKILKVGEFPADAQLDKSQLAALSTTVMNLFNLDETIHHE